MDTSDRVALFQNISGMIRPINDDDILPIIGDPHGRAAAVQSHEVAKIERRLTGVACFKRMLI